MALKEYFDQLDAYNLTTKQKKNGRALLREMAEDVKEKNNNCLKWDVVKEAIEKGDKAHYDLFKNNFKTKARAMRCDKWEKLNKTERAKHIKEVVKLHYIEAFERKAEKIFNLLECSETLESVQISTTWARSYTWGYNPHAVADVRTKDQSGLNHWARYEGGASGCGYDKLSSAYDYALTQSKAFKKAVLLYMLENGASGKLQPCDGVYMSGAWGFFIDFAGHGVGSLRHIMEEIGMRKVCESGTKTTDFIYFEKIGA